MRSAARLVFATLTLAALTFAPAAAASEADEDLHDCAFEAGLGKGECEHFLRNPAAVPDDPCFCDKCRNGITGQKHDGRTIPPGWNPTLFETGGVDAYLKRHSVAWSLVCSECMTTNKPWPDGGNGSMGTPPAKDYGGRPAKDTVLGRLVIEKRLLKKSDQVFVLYNSHFYVVSDIPDIKVKTPGGSSRLMSGHEWAHLMLERAEFARREWVRNLGEPIVLKASVQRPVAVYVTKTFRDFERVGTEYFKQAGSRGLKGPVAELCDGLCLSGITFSLEEAGSDHEMLVQLRHEIAHAMLAMWGSLEVRPKSMPVWLDEGIAHWLTKSIAKCRDNVFYCTGEGLGGPSGGGVAGGMPGWSGKDWDKDCAKYAVSAKVGPIEELFGKTVLSELKEEDQKRAWSILDLCLAEIRVPFAKTLAALRKEVNVREAFMTNLGCPPEALYDRWRQRVTGKRKSMAPNASDLDTDAENTPGVRDRRAIASETDPKKLAYKIRQLGEIKDAKTIPFVVDVIAQDLDLPRETALVTLLNVKDAACRDAIWNYGLTHPEGMVRAYVARICGRLKLDAAREKLIAQLEDKNWYARAEAAVACGTFRDIKAMAGLRKIVASDSSDKARVGAMDALAMYGEDASMAVPLVAKLLDSSQWQLRIAAAKTLGAIGSMEGVEPLVARFEKEPTGRIADEVFAALKTLSRDDLGRKAEHWRKWWEREKAAAPGGKPRRPPESEKKGPDPNDKHATRADEPPAAFFDVEIYSNRVAFVCDTSESMLELFTPDPSAAKALSREYSGSNKLAIMKEEVAQALSSLDPRSHFNVVTFGTDIRSFKSAPVPASPGNVESAKGFLAGLTGRGETNYYDALKTALDIGANPDTNPDFKPTPDTITFLTDGQPTKGDILDADVILEWYTGLNRYARVKTHTITFGVINVDTQLLKAMAEKNGGRFTIVPEKKK